MTTYAGTVAGQSFSSLYPNAYRVQYVAQIGGRRLDVDKVVTACDEYHARDRVNRSMGSAVFGAIVVELVGVLVEARS